MKIKFDYNCPSCNALQHSSIFRINRFVKKCSVCNEKHKISYVEKYKILPYIEMIIPCTIASALTKNMDEVLKSYMLSLLFVFLFFLLIYWFDLSIGAYDINVVSVQTK